MKDKKIDIVSAPENRGSKHYIFEKGGIGEVERFIEVNNSFMLNKEAYNSREQFITILLRGLSTNLFDNTVILNLDTLLSYYLSLGAQTKNVNAIKETLVSMERKGLITMYKDLLKTERIDIANVKKSESLCIEVSNDSAVEEKRDYKKLTFNELRKFVIMKESGKHISFAIYYNITKRIFEGETNYKACNPTIETIMKETGFDDRTITKHLKILKENELLEYKTLQAGKDKKNYYCKWEDRDEFDEDIEALREYQISR